ncbi:50S ribosomal protein L17 [bacterium]|nr:50S ribosomal protein L17 [candidate division CSSED10-310 bacterium]
MRHRKQKVKLGRDASHRNAMIRNMTASLIEHERIRTTLHKAKGVRRTVDHVITLAKREDLHARRQVMEIIQDKEIVKKLFDTLASRYADRPGGFTRIYRLDNRRGDAAEMAVIELVDAEFASTE